jgi:hypothetical protein
MHEAGYPIDDILRAQAAYRLSCRLFNGRYRKTERAFICHAVGAASAAVFSKPPVETVAAAMLHASYDSGQFPDGKTGRRSVAHREWLVGQIGAEIESIVARYLGFDFETGGPEKLVENGFSDNDRDLLFIALSHEVDDLADGGLAFSPKYGESVASRINACANLARQIGYQSLAATIEQYGTVYEDLSWTGPLQKTKLEGFRVAPNLRAYMRLRRDHRRGKGVDII